MTQDRREFLKRSGALASAAALGGCGPGEAPDDGVRAARLDPAMLRGVAEVVLPSELDTEIRENAVRAFETWAEDYEPVAELNHGYGTSEIAYGPPDPVPGWGAQLQALDVEAAKRHGASFVELAPDVRERLLRRHLDTAGEDLGSPLHAGHVAVALMAHWFRSADALDRCYGVRIGERTCRGIDTAPREPEAL